MLYETSAEKIRQVQNQMSDEAAGSDPGLMDRLNELGETAGRVLATVQELRKLLYPITVPHDLPPMADESAAPRPLSNAELLVGDVRSVLLRTLEEMHALSGSVRL